MPEPIQSGLWQQALARIFGVKGRWNITLDEVMVPTFTIQSYAFDPESQLRSIGFTRSRGAVVGELGAVGIIAAANSSVNVRQIRITNVSGEALEFAVRMLNRTALAAITVDSSGQARITRSLTPEAQGSNNAMAQQASFSEAAVSGTSIDHVAVPDNTSVTLDLPWGLCLYGTGSAFSFQALLVWCLTANTAFQVAMHGHEVARA